MTHTQKRPHLSKALTPAASDIRSFDEFWDILKQHILLSCHRYLNDLLTFYGNKAPVAPSPMLSALIGGCLESGRDLTTGGARYHLFSPLMTGISTAADSLHVIKELVFHQQRFTLEELVSCLASNWGQNPAAPGRHVAERRTEEIHRLCMDFPKFGQGKHESITGSRPPQTRTSSRRPGARHRNKATTRW